jgi:hypothetical protein
MQRYRWQPSYFFAFRALLRDVLTAAVLLGVGAPDDRASAEPVGAEPKVMAAKRLTTLAAGKAAKAAKSKKAAKKVAGAAPADVKPAPAPPPPIDTPSTTPERLRDRVRAALLRRSA